MSEDLKHVGVLGMHWGVRRGSGSGSSDHKAVAAIRKKRLKDMTDDEIRTVAARMKLVKEFKQSAGPFAKHKPISSMSNDELSAGVNRHNLTKEDWTVGVRKTKRIREMSDAEVKATLDRHLLEKSYKEVAGLDHSRAEKLVNALIRGG